MPSYNKQDEADKKDNGNIIASPKPVEEPSSAVKFFPMKHPDSGNCMNKSQVVQENSCSQVD